MKYPKVITVNPINNHTLLVCFDNNQKKTYNITPLLEKDMFLPLKNPILFKSVKVERGGYAVYWNENIDLSESELWKHGKKFNYNLDE